MKLILDMIRRAISDLKDQNDKLKGACASQIAAKAWSKDEAYDEVLKILDTRHANADDAGFVWTSVTWNDVKEIVSHKQALLQCSEFLQSLGNVKITECENTAMAAERVANSDEPGIAAICSPLIVGSAL